MTSADLFYNPYLQKAALYIGGTIRDYGRLGSFINGRPIDEWLVSYSRGEDCGFSQAKCAFSGSINLHGHDT